jgi:hypothetical protein
MNPLLLANFVLIVHLAFVLFVVFGGVLVLRDRKLVWLHLPALAWGIAIELAGWVCPLTPLENYYLRLSGEAGYAGGFIERMISRVLYPVDLTPALRYVLASLLIAVNATVYAFVIVRKRHAM